MNASESTHSKLLEKLESLPALPGVYLFRGAAGEALYVGKAKSLRSRVRSYFGSTSDSRAFIPLLAKAAVDLETVVTASEKEAAILENNLIKEHKPRYNVKLRDDKEFLSLRVSLDHPWPRLEVVRRPLGDGAKYFGPYHSATAARRTLHLVNKHFQLRTCSDAELQSRKRPCLQFQIRRCPAPCVREVDPTFYRGQVETVLRFLAGRHDELKTELEGSMQEASASMQFELAAIYRDQLAAIRNVREGQRAVTVERTDRDVFGLYREGGLVEVATVHVRQGRIADIHTTSTKANDVPNDELVGTLLSQRYGSEGAIFPEEIVVEVLPEAAEGIADWFSEKAGRRILVVAPKRGARADLLRMAQEQAKHAFSEKKRQKDDVEERLFELSERLRLTGIPRRIECCDISHLGGKDTVGAIVAMHDGVLVRKHYKTFHVRGGVEGGESNNDYASMYEVLSRRFRRGRDAREDDVWELPDLFVVDGGPGQLAMALAAAKDLGLHDLAMVGLAKERENALGETLVDRVYLPGQKNPIPLRKSTSLFLLAQLRDEAHRFSNEGRKRRGKKRRFESELDHVPGIGKTLRTRLLKQFGSLARLRAASDADLLSVPGVQKRHVKALREAWGLRPGEGLP